MHTRHTKNTKQASVSMLLTDSGQCVFACLFDIRHLVGLIGKYSGYYTVCIKD